jgi:hypothetical protein
MIAVITRADCMETISPDGAGGWSEPHPIVVT